MGTISDRGDGGHLLVLLPGAFMTAQDFVGHDFIGAVRRLGSGVDVIAVDTGVNRYLDGHIVERLHDEIILPARAEGRKKIWLAGISLGAMGALLYAKQYTNAIAALLLLSPFIGSRGIVAEVEVCGGLRHWDPAARDDQTIERRLLAWLKSYRAGCPGWPDIRMGYGAKDRFAPAHQLLAEILPSNNVVTESGGHDWDTWERLWVRLLATNPFTADDGGERI
jgi:pimeloyl-ACP methyl ester carboxylesterase